MLYREIIAVCSEIHTKHINTVCGLNVEFVNVKLAAHLVTTMLYRVQQIIIFQILFSRSKRACLSQTGWPPRYSTGTKAESKDWIATPNVAA